MLQAAASNAVSWLELLLVFIDLLGLTRAWDLLGAHRYRFQELLKPRRDAEKGEAAPSKDSSE